jgi:hypothetical protein
VMKGESEVLCVLMINDDKDSERMNYNDTV